MANERCRCGCIAVAAAVPPLRTFITFIQNSNKFRALVHGAHPRGWVHTGRVAWLFGACEAKGRSIYPSCLLGSWERLVFVAQALHSAPERWHTSCLLRGPTQTRL